MDREKFSYSLNRETEKEVMCLAWSLGRPIRPRDIIECSKVKYRTARKRLHTEKC